MPDQETTLRNVEKVMKLVEKLSEPRRSAVRAMLDGPVGETYFSAPASRQVDYHSCYPGGLVQHSLNVLVALYNLTEALCPDKYQKEQLIFVALFHDLGKVGDGKNEYYLPNDSDWHREKLGQLYKINKDCAYMPTAERGLYLLQLHGVPVTFDEYVAIRLNDGQYVEENRPYRSREPELALLLHWADMWSCVQEKKEV